MGNTACTIKHITVTTVHDGVRYFGGVDKQGMELADVQTDADFGPNKRTYFCSNCMRVFDGTNTDSFEVVKKHFGTFPV